MCYLTASYSSFIFKRIESECRDAVLGFLWFTLWFFLLPSSCWDLCVDWIPCPGCLCVPLCVCLLKNSLAFCPNLGRVLLYLWEKNAEGKSVKVRRSKQVFVSVHNKSFWRRWKRLCVAKTSSSVWAGRSRASYLRWTAGTCCCFRWRGRAATTPPCPTSTSTTSFPALHRSARIREGSSRRYECLKEVETHLFSYCVSLLKVAFFFPFWKCPPLLIHTKML